MRRRTKIVATAGAQRTEHDENQTDELGPFVGGVIPHGELLARFIAAGVDIVRLNMSFASLEDPYELHEEAYLAWLNMHKSDAAARVAVCIAEAY